MAKVELKQPIVDEISGVINGAQSVVVVDYLGLTVAEDTQLRKQLREAGVTYKVYKNTLVNRAIQGTEFEGLKDVLEGPSAFAVSAEDATAPARILAKFAKTAPALEIKAGVVEGTFYDAEGMKAISAVPSRDELLGKLLGSIQSPITNLTQSDCRAGWRCRCSRRGSTSRGCCRGSSSSRIIQILYLNLIIIIKFLNGGNYNGKVNNSRVY